MPGLGGTGVGLVSGKPVMNKPYATNEEILGHSTNSSNKPFYTDHDFLEQQFAFDYMHRSLSWSLVRTHIRANIWLL